MQSFPSNMNRHRPADHQSWMTSIVSSFGEYQDAALNQITADESNGSGIDFVIDGDGYRRVSGEDCN